MIDTKCDKKPERMIDYEILHLLKSIYAKGGRPEFVGNFHKLINIWEKLVNSIVIDKQDLEFFIGRFSNPEFIHRFNEEFLINSSLLNIKLDYMKNKIIELYLNSCIEKNKLELLDILKSNSKGGEKFEIYGDKMVFAKDEKGVISTKLTSTIILKGHKEYLYLVKDSLLNDMILDQNGNVLFKGINVSVIGEKYVRVDGKLYDCRGNELLNGMKYIGHILVGNNYYFLQISKGDKKYYVDEKGNIVMNGIKFEQLKGYYFYGGKDFFYGMSENNTFILVDTSGEIIFENNDTNLKFDTVCKLPLLQSIKKSNGECIFLLEHNVLDFSLFFGKDGKVGFFYQQNKGRLTPYIIYESSRFKGNRIIDVDGKCLFQNYIDSNPNIEFFKVNSMIHLTDIGYLFDIIVISNGIKFHIILDTHGNRLFAANGKLNDILGILKSIDGKVYLNALLEQKTILGNAESNKLIQLDGKLVNRSELSGLFNFEFVPIEI